MSDQENRVTRAARAVWEVTSQIFRCPGLQPVPHNADNLGVHDLAYWVIFLAVMAAWFLFVFAPQAERLGMLAERTKVLKTHLEAEKRELARLQRSLKQLQQNDPQAWERAARGRLGWVEPGEITDLSHGLSSRQAGNSPAAPPEPRPAMKPPAALPRPAIPPLPVPPAGLRPQDLVAGNQAGAELLGPSCGSPPLPPQPSQTPQPPLATPQLARPQRVQPAVRSAPRPASYHLASRQ
ncbi:MAG: hypothetical protein ABSE73_21665 [Planctomycetota bacterium]